MPVRSGVHGCWRLSKPETPVSTRRGGFSPEAGGTQDSGLRRPWAVTQERGRQEGQSTLVLEDLPPGAPTWLCA